MPIVSAGRNEYLLTGRRGTLENRGSAVRAVLLPGAIHVLVPSTKQEALFEFTQETRDGIPLKFKGIVIYRITDPIAAARLFDFHAGQGTAQISVLLTHVCLGELRHAVSQMTMIECIEQRKTTLSAVARGALEATVHGGEPAGWGIDIEVAQLAQVFIVDMQLRQQLEAEVRNEIRLKSEQSDIRTLEEARLATMASASRVEDRQPASDRENLRRGEELELAKLARERRMQAEGLVTERQRLELERDRFRAEMDAEQDRVEVEAPVRLLRAARETEALRAELVTRQLQDDVRALEVVRDLRLARAQQDLRREILPLEQAPQIVEAASGVLRGTNLSIYGDEAGIVGQLAPLLEIVGRAVHSTMNAGEPEERRA